MRKIYNVVVFNIVYYLLILGSYLRGNIEYQIKDGRKIRVIKNDLIVRWYGFGYGVAVLDRGDIFMEENLNDDINDFVKFHEMGHIINGHYKDERNLSDELEADSYAIGELFKLGYNKKEIENIIREMMNRSIRSFINSDLEKEDKEYYIDLLEKERKERIENIKKQRN
jgi:hypothetical protein